ncbi:MAG: hypothetical protein OQK35_02630 [Alphaproteobacteria bacterium]|nr:hypothetical protein [Alphaproteobacteria bacterium]
MVLWLRSLNTPIPKEVRSGKTPQRRELLDILKERLARGEIAKEEFNELQNIFGE